MWNHPETVPDLSQIFVKYCRNEISALPWSDSPLALESTAILESLVKCNHEGFLTINSQPAVDGEDSSHPVYGWGPKHGFVYQKAYIEFFVSPEAMETLIERMDLFPYLTFYAVNKEVNESTKLILG
jgi:methylenetetrahydrofolate reductase (NADPH)